MDKRRPDSASITRRQWLAAASALGAELLTSRQVQGKQTTKPTRRPNLLLFFPDQMRRHALGFARQDPVWTPNMDRFASQGLYLPHATSTFPLCTPWRGMMMSSRFPHETGLVNNSNSSRPAVYLRREERCLTDVLHDQGYHIGYIGKWHLTAPHQPYLPDISHDDGLAWDEFTPPEDRHGIDHWYGYNAYDDHFRPRYWSTHAKREEYRYVDQWSPEHEADRIIEYLENSNGRIRNSERPFALIASMNPPHPPYNKVPDRYLKHYAGKTSRDLLGRPNVRFTGSAEQAQAAGVQYFSAINGVDEQFGRVMSALSRLGLEQDTLVLLTCDHGDMMGSQGLMGKPFPYEEAFNIPMVFRWPGKIPAGKSDDLLIGTTDLMPTLLGLLGCSPAIPKQARGTDYSGLLTGGNAPAGPSAALYIDSANGGHRGVRTHTHTLVLGTGRKGEPAIRLFDNVNDPYQLRNTAAGQPDLVAHLQATTLDWLLRIGDPWKM